LSHVEDIPSKKCNICNLYLHFKIFKFNKGKYHELLSSQQFVLDILKQRRYQRKIQWRTSRTE